MKTAKSSDTHSLRTTEEMLNKDRLLQLLLNSPIHKEEVLDNLGLFLVRQNMCRFLFLHELYRKILYVHGVVVEFGVRWGQNLALFESLRGIYEPYNHNRKIIGFDTFTGFPSVHEKDGSAAVVRDGGYGVPEGYESYLADVLDCHERESPLSHLKKFCLVKGDVRQTLDEYLSEHPETIIALAYFDLDLYEPTVHCLRRIRAHLVKGSVVGFDELNCQEFPGETLALREELGLGEVRLQRLPFSPTTSYFVVE